MKVECYRNDTVNKSILNDVDDSRKKICQELGLSRQAKILSGNAGNFYPAMTREELFIWGRFLPSFYSKNDGDWKKYDFDVIPEKSLEEIQFAASLRFFTDLEIWTPESRTIDPLVVGLVGARKNPNVVYHMIVRWGESLRDFSEIRQEIFATFQKNDTSEEVPPIAQAYMNEVVINGKLKNIHFKGFSLLKSPCCKERVYKFVNPFIRKDLVCSKCGDVRIKWEW